MQYIELKEKLKGFTIFSLNEVRKFDAQFYRRRLNEWQEKGYVRKVIKGYYIFSDLNCNENTLFEIANRIYGPSYISFEMALAYYELIPESVYGITSASIRRTYTFKTCIGEFFYRAIKRDFFFGYELIKYQDKYFKIASVEKTILDYFYLNPHIKTVNDFASLRINKDVLLARVDKKRFFNYLARFNKKILTERVKIFWRYIENA